MLEKEVKFLTRLNVFPSSPDVLSKPRNYEIVLQTFQSVVITSPNIRALYTSVI